MNRFRRSKDGTIHRQGRSRWQLGGMSIAFYFVLGISLGIHVVNAQSIATNPSPKLHAARVMFLRPLVQPVSELLLKAKSPRRFRIIITLKGADLMNTFKVSPEVKDWCGPRLPVDPNCREIDFSQTAKEGDPITMENAKDFPYPVTFQQPTVLKDLGAPGVIPITPTEFKICRVGWNLRVCATVSGGFINLSVDALFTKAKAQSNKTVYGENTEPIYVTMKNSSGKTENALMTQNLANIPFFEISQTLLYVFALPNKDYPVKIQQGNEWVGAMIRVERVP